MLTRLFLITVMLFTFPTAFPAWGLSVDQESYCRTIGTRALHFGEARDARVPRSEVLLLLDNVGHPSQDERTFTTGLVYWVYEHPELSGTELYVSIVTVCRNEFVQRSVAEMQTKMHTALATICARQADMGILLAEKARTITQKQAFTMLREVDPSYADKAADYAKLVPFVYARRKMAPAALRTAVTQYCQANLEQQYGVEIEQQQGWRR